MNRKIFKFINAKATFSKLDIKMFRDSPNLHNPNEGPFLLHSFLSNRFFFDIFPVAITIPHHLIASHALTFMASEASLTLKKDLVTVIVQEVLRQLYENWNFNGIPYQNLDFINENALYPVTSLRLSLYTHFVLKEIHSFQLGPEPIPSHGSNISGDNPYQVHDILWGVLSEATKGCIDMAAWVHHYPDEAWIVDDSTTPATRIRAEGEGAVLSTTFKMRYEMVTAKPVDGMQTLVIAITANIVQLVRS